MRYSHAIYHVRNTTLPANSFDLQFPTPLQSVKAVRISQLISIPLTEYIIEQGRNNVLVVQFWQQDAVDPTVFTPIAPIRSIVVESGYYTAQQLALTISTAAASFPTPLTCSYKSELRKLQFQSTGYFTIDFAATTMKKEIGLTTAISQPAQTVTMPSIPSLSGTQYLDFCIRNAHTTNHNVPFEPRYLIQRIPVSVNPGNIMFDVHPVIERVFTVLDNRTYGHFEFEILNDRGVPYDFGAYNVEFVLEVIQKISPLNSYQLRHEVAPQGYLDEADY